MATAGAQSTAPDLSHFTASYSLPFAEPADFAHLDKTLKVNMRLNGGPESRFTVDTGSVGIVVSAEEVPNIDPKAKPGVLRYSSSGVELHGVWTTATVTFPDAQGAPGAVATAVVPVLAVSSETCAGSGVNSDRCQPNDHPHPHMLGIGFGRGEKAHPEMNPFVNLREMQTGTMRRGYIITPKGITLGLTPANVSNGFVWQKLKEMSVSAETAAFNPGLRDWETAPGGFRVGSSQSPLGTVLIDTGLTNMMLAIPDNPAKGDLIAGAPVTVELLGGKLHYSFVVNDAGNPATPRKVTWVRATHGVFTNTGLRALSLFDYLYDADGGWLALRPRKP
ncbi:MAG: hypothetical protein V4555_20330 [Acidobacteriota bacterium]